MHRMFHHYQSNPINIIITPATPSLPLSSPHSGQSTIPRRSTTTSINPYETEETGDEKISRILHYPKETMDEIDLDTPRSFLLHPSTYETAHHPSQLRKQFQARSTRSRIVLAILGFVALLVGVVFFLGVGGEMVVGSTAVYLPVQGMGLGPEQGEGEGLGYGQIGVGHGDLLKRKLAFPLRHAYGLERTEVQEGKKEVLEETIEPVKNEVQVDTPIDLETQVGTEFTDPPLLTIILSEPQDSQADRHNHNLVNQAKLSTNRPVSVVDISSTQKLLLTQSRERLGRWKIKKDVV